MKPCPFCNATLEDDARFCLYCMTSLEDKRTIAFRDTNVSRTLIIAAAVVIAAILAVMIWFSVAERSDNTDNETAQTTVSTTVSTTTSTTDTLTTTVGKEEPFPTDDVIAGVSDDSDITVNAVTPPTTTTSSKAKTTTKVPTTTARSTTTATAAQTASAAYSYRDATHDDVYLDMTIAVPDDTVVITGIVSRPSDGVYVVPNTIDGKRVISIGGGAFTGDDVKVVVLPENVSTINENAFSGCKNLTDIYYGSDKIYTYPGAFAPVSSRTGTLTIHCSADCSNRNFRYYRNIASDWFAADFKEWNGGELT